MRRRAVVVAGLAAAAGGSLLVLPDANAASLCIDLAVDVNGNGQAQQVCLPPEGTELPGLPGLPAR